MRHRQAIDRRRRGILMTIAIAGWSFAGCWLVACTTTTNGRPGAGSTPVAIGVAGPDELHELSGYLLSFRARFRLLPSDLEQMRRDGALSTRDQMALEDLAIDTYAYAPGGLGVLPDGRVIQLVDSEIRVPDHVWCIVREKTDRPRTAALAVELVPLEALDAAATG